MPLFKRKSESRKAAKNDDDWDNWKKELPAQQVHTPRSADSTESQRRGSVSNRGAPRSILRNPSYGQEAASDNHKRHSVANVTASKRMVPEGRDRFQSLPASNSLSAFPSQHRDPQFGSCATSTSLSQLNARNAVSCKYDAESDRLDRACGQGAFAPSRFSSRGPDSRDSRCSEGFGSRSLSRSRSRSRDSHCQRSRQNGVVPRFPMPSIQQAIRDLTRILRDRTKRFRLKDYLEPEEIISGRIWEEEEETLVDCVRDHVDDEDGEDGIWMVEKKKRQMKRKAQREKTMREGNIFGAHIQDLPTTAMSRVVIGGYTHIVPMIVDACIEELYRTGAYKPHLFRSLPNRKRLLDLVTHFDQAAARGRANSVTSGPDMKVYAKTQSFHAEETADICALLVTYLSSLPDSLIHRSLSDALWAWCVSPSIIRQEQRLRRQGDDDASQSEYETSEDEDEDAPSYNTRLRKMEFERMNLPPLKVQILVAQHVLLLLPARHFSLLVHLMTFFATLLVCPENGLGADDVGRIFGPIFMGRKNDKQHEQEGTEDAEQHRGLGDRREKDRKITVWLVNHWERISTAYEPKSKDSDRLRARRTRSASVGDEDELRRRGSQSDHGSRGRGRDVRASVQTSKDKQPDRRPSGRRASAPILSHNDGIPHKRNTLKPPLGDNIDACPSVIGSLTSGSTASSSESDAGERYQAMPVKHRNQPAKATRQPGSIRICNADERSTPGSLQEDLVLHNMADDASVYSNDDVLDSVLGRYLDEPTPKSRSSLFDNSSDAQGTYASDRGDKGANDRSGRDLRKQLEQVRRERDEAREMVSAMRRIVEGATRE